MLDPSLTLPPTLPADAQPSALLRQLLAQFAATGLPMAMIHHDEPQTKEVP